MDDVKSNINKQIEKLSICDVFKDDTSEVIRKLELQTPLLFQNYSNLHAAYLHMFDDLFGTCYISEKEFFDNLNVDQVIDRLDNFIPFLGKIIGFIVYAIVVESVLRILFIIKQKLLPVVDKKLEDRIEEQIDEKIKVHVEKIEKKHETLEKKIEKENSEIKEKIKKDTDEIEKKVEKENSTSNRDPSAK